MTHRSRPPATLDTIADQLEKLRNDIDHLDRNVKTLCGRIEPFENEPTQVSCILPPIDLPAKPDLDWIAKQIAAMRAHLDNSERDLAALRSKIDAMESGAYLKDELGPYLKPRRKDR